MWPDGLPMSASCCSRASTFPTRRVACRRRSRRAAGSAERSSATTRSPSCAPAPSAAGALPSSVAPGSTASGSRRTAGTSVSRRSGRSAATGAGVETSAWRRSARPRASEDGRGPRTSLERLVPEHFGLAAPHELVRAIHVGRFSEREVIALSPLVLAAAADDAVAAEIVDRLAAEVVALAGAALTRLGLIGESAHVVLGGGLLQSRRCSPASRHRNPAARARAGAGHRRGRVAADRRLGAARSGRASRRAEAQQRLRRELGDSRRTSRDTTGGGLSGRRRVQAGDPDLFGYRRARRERPRSPHRGRRVHGSRRPVRLGQDDGAPHAGRPRGGRRR